MKFLLFLLVSLMVAAPACAQEPETWEKYWSEHKVQEKTSRPIRWFWHKSKLGWLWDHTGTPGFHTVCSAGRWSRQTGLTDTMGMIGAGLGSAAAIRVWTDKSL